MRMTALGVMKRRINALLRPTGHAFAHEGVVPSFERFAEHLRKYALAPAMVFDIGIAEGTPWLYEAFPTASYILCDPTRESLPHMQKWAKSLRAQIWHFALGEEETTLEINVRREIGGSTFFKEIGKSEITARYQVPVKRFDAVAGEIERPALCKIDVQGAELAVLRGMGERLRELDAVIVETSVIATIEQGPELPEVMAFMRERDFTPFEIVGITRRPLDQALPQIDLVFVPEDSRLRSDRRWAGTS